MIEKVLSFGPDGILAGVLAEPAPGRAIPGAPAVLMWNVGINHHVGPYRINVELARRLAERGFCALRFDISGMGDSEVRRGAPAAMDRAVDDVREAMNVLERRRGIRTFVVVGFCSSVDAAHALALVDERVVGTAYLEGYAYRTRGFWIRYPLRFLDRARWERYLSRRFPRFFSGPTGTSAVDPSQAERGDRGSIYVRDIPRPEKFAADVRQMVQRGVRLFFVYVGGDTDFNHAGQLREMIGRGRGAPRLELEFLPDADHTFFRLEDRARVVDVTCRWVDRHFGQAESVVARDAEQALDAKQA